ncbi:MAG: glycosyl transferase group 1, partial [uncultured bacterium]
MKTIIYIGNFSFPFGNASGKRVYANGQVLRTLGYKVLFIGVDNKVTQKSEIRDTEDEHDGFKYYNLPYPQNYIDWINYKNAYIKLITFIKQERLLDNLEFVILYGSPSLSLFNTKVHKFCKHNNIKVLTDCVDWLTTKTKNPIFNLIKWVDNTYQKAYVNNKVDGVIVISKYLEEYYKKFGKKTIIVPPLSPIEFKFAELGDNLDTMKVITYAGQPFRIGKRITDLNTLKDRIDKTIVLLIRAKEKGCEFIFNIYGFTKDEYLVAIPSQTDCIEKLGDSVFFHGLKSNEEVVKVILLSDFTILIRDINRDTAAGFPTKVSESISCGTPVITTKTSDLEKYIKEGYNGFFLDAKNEKNSISELVDIL